MSTYSAKPNEIERKWWVVDLEGKTLGRAATRIATILRGKHKPVFTPHVDTGDFVVVVNAGKFRVTGKKMSQKLYRHHSLYPGGLKEVPMEKMLERHPELAIQIAVKKMLPRNKLSEHLIRKLKIYAGSEHPHQAQKPEPLDI